MKPAAFYVLPAILLIAMIACSNTDDDPIIDEDLLNVVWKVDSLQTPEARIAPGPDTIIVILETNDTTFVPSRSDPSITIQFKADMTLRGLAACNWCEGNYEIAEKGSISIDITTVTEMACVREMFIEYTFIQALENIMAYVIAENRFTLYDRDSSYVLNFSTE